VPPKAIATDPTLKFEFFLAEKLSRTVAELREMSNDEFLHWQAYYALEAQQIELESKRGAGGRRNG
jgi:hypothetical protein